MSSAVARPFGPRRRKMARESRQQSTATDRRIRQVRNVHHYIANRKMEGTREVIHSKQKIEIECTDIVTKTFLMW